MLTSGGRGQGRLQVVPDLIFSEFTALAPGLRANGDAGPRGFVNSSSSFLVPLRGVGCMRGTGGGQRRRWAFRASIGRAGGELPRNTLLKAAGTRRSLGAVPQGLAQWST